MRLTNHDRNAVKERALEAAFEPREAVLKSREHDLGMKFYKLVLPEGERRAAAKLSKRWVARNACLRFSARGANLDFGVKEAVIVPANAGYCSVLGALDDANADEAIAHHDAKQTLRDNRKDARNKLSSLLDSVATLKQLEETWPEGKPFYQHLGSDVRLPVPIAKDVNAVLGLRSAA